jgi:FMN phosphatase YigB (HAD superfamily)
MKTTHKNKKRTTKRTLKGGAPPSTIFYYTNPNNEKIEIDLEPLLNQFDVFAWDFDDTIMHVPNSTDKLGRYTSSKINLIGKSYGNINKNGYVTLTPKNLPVNSNGYATLETNNSITNEYFYTEYFMNNATNFVEFVLFLKKHKKQVAIITFGFRKTVESALTKIFTHYYNEVINEKPPKVLPFYFENLKPKSSTNTSNNNSLLYSEYNSPTIYGPDKDTMGKNQHNKSNMTDYRNIGRSRKVNYMEDVMKNFTVSADRILFFDDDYNNNQALSEIGVTAVTVPGQKMIEYILNFYVNSTKEEEKKKMEPLFTPLKNGFNVNLIALINEYIKLFPTKKLSFDYLYVQLTEEKKLTPKELEYLTKLKESDPEKKEIAYTLLKNIYAKLKQRSKK